MHPVGRSSVASDNRSGLTSKMVICWFDRFFRLWVHCANHKDGVSQFPPNELCFPRSYEASELTRWIEITDGGYVVAGRPAAWVARDECDCGPCRPHHRPCKCLAGTHRMWPIRPRPRAHWLCSLGRIALTLNARSARLAARHFGGRSASLSLLVRHKIYNFRSTFCSHRHNAIVGSRSRCRPTATVIIKSAAQFSILQPRLLCVYQSIRRHDMRPPQSKPLRRLPGPEAPGYTVRPAQHRIISGNHG
jgi:hypothetical protein